MQNCVRSATAILQALCIHIVIVLGTAAALFMQPSFLINECRQLDTAAELKMRECDVETAVTVMYRAALDGDRLTYMTHVRGTYTDFFTVRDAEHLKSVNSVINRLRIVLAVAASAAAAVTVAATARRWRYHLAVWYLRVTASFAVLAVLTVLSASHRIIYIVNNMHRLLFSDSLWILNPAEDNMIWFFPEKMYFDAGVRFGCTVAGINAVLIIACAACIGRYRRHNACSTAS